LIREQEPSKPSTKLSTAEGLPTLAANRGTEPAKLTKLVRGELDWIVMKALEKDRNRRYETANGFAMDVQRYLADEQVLACPASVGYRLRKFARRNKRGLVTAALLGVTLMAAVGVVAGTVGWMSRDRAARRLVVEEAATRALDEADERQKQGKWQEALAAAERAKAALASGEGGTDLQEQVAEQLATLRMIAQLQEIRAARLDYFDGEGANREYVRAFTDFGIDADTLSPAEIAARIGRRPATAVRMAAALDDWAMVRRDLGLYQKQDSATWKRLLEAARLADSDPWRSQLRQLLGREELNALRELADTSDITRLPVQSLQLMGNALVFSGDGDNSNSACVAWLRKAHRQHPGDVYISFDLAFHLANSPSRHSPEVLQFYEAALAARPQSAALHTTVGNVLFNLGRHDEGIAAYRRAIDLKPDYAEAHFKLGNAYSHLKQYDKAVSDYSKAIAVKPDFAKAHVYLGSALHAKGELDKAITAFRKAVELDARDAARAHCDLGMELKDQKKLDEAIAEFRTAIELDPKSAFAHLRLGWALHDQKKLEEAIAEYRKATELDPKDAGAHCILIDAMEAQGDLLGAVAVYEKAIAIMPDLAKKRKPAMVRARYYVHLSQWDKAAAEYAKAGWPRPLPEDACAYACLFLVRGDGEGYHSFCQQMIQRAADTHDPFESFVLARCCAMARKSPVDPARAVQWAKQALASAERGWYFHVVGLAQYRAGQFDQALQSFTESKVMAGCSKLNWFGLALVHHSLGHPDEARRCLAKGIQWLEQKAPPSPEQPVKLMPWDWLEALLLRREAEEMLKIKQSP